MPSVGPRVHDDVKVDRCDNPVPVGSRAELHDHGVTGAGRDELLGPGELQEDGPACGQGQGSADVLDEDLLFSAEAAADAGFDHVDPAYFHLEPSRDDPPHMEGHLGAGADLQAPPLIQEGQRDVWLHGTVLALVEIVLALRGHV